MAAFKLRYSLGLTLLQETTKAGLIYHLTNEI